MARVNIFVRPPRKTRHAEHSIERGLLLLGRGFRNLSDDLGERRKVVLAIFTDMSLEIGDEIGWRFEGALWMFHVLGADRKLLLTG